ncbi:MAG TPA: hypothetical protein PKN04_17125, partial [bacterium]|nr:hypothetical protein [bacterium]
IGFRVPPTDTGVLIDFYSRVRPFGVWQPIRKLAIQQGRIDPDNHESTYDWINGLITMVFQLSLALIPFYAFLRQWPKVVLWSVIFVVVSAVLYFTWYRQLPPRNEEALFQRGTKL